jgi:integrative and conjugative element protein (TIGR02256 family)
MDQSPLLNHVSDEDTMRFCRLDGGEFCLLKETVAALNAHRQLKSSSHEAGGVLLGRFYSSSRDVVVETVTTPNREDRRSRFSFFRAQRPAQNAVKDAWNRSRGQQNYLGEWHTHPEDHPTPSSIDLDDWLRLCRTAVFEQESLFFLIVGRQTTRAWEMRRNSRNPIALQEVTDDGEGPVSTFVAQGES